MTRTDLDHTRVVRAWLAAGSEELSPRVLETVLREFPATNQDRPHWAAAWPQFSSFAAGAAVGAAVAVTLAVAMVGGGLLDGYLRGGTGTTTSTPTPSPTPSSTAETASPTPNTIDYSYRDVGFIGLPPVGATPSDPTETEQVENLWRPGVPYSGQAFLYADGRLIWLEYFGGESTGWLEQTLTDDGVEMVRALTLRTLEDGTRLLDPEELPGLLPARAWADRTARPYVPSGFAACLFVVDQEEPSIPWNMTREEMLDALPREAAELLRDGAPVLDASASYGAETPCVALDVAEARRLDAALRAAGLPQDDVRNSFLLEYHTVLDRLDEGTWWLSVWFEPILPDGTITCSSCG